MVADLRGYIGLGTGPLTSLEEALHEAVLARATREIGTLKLEYGDFQLLQLVIEHMASAIVEQDPGFQMLEPANRFHYLLQDRIVELGGMRADLGYAVIGFYSASKTKGAVYFQSSFPLVNTRFGALGRALRALEILEGDSRNMDTPYVFSPWLILDEGVKGEIRAIADLVAKEWKHAPDLTKKLR